MRLPEVLHLPAALESVAICCQGMREESTARVWRKSIMWSRRARKKSSVAASANITNLPETHVSPGRPALAGTQLQHRVRRQKDLKVELRYRRSAAPLDLLVESTDIKFLGEGEWKRKKHGAEFRRQWRKVHLGINASTLESGLSKSRTTPQQTHRCCRTSCSKSP